ncbi:MAG: DUF4393 domain-containing protein [Oscillospiraceae bacterium]|nr:DUF4393 domain-containing protein [Oscillospiraceae bacterium]
MSENNTSLLPDIITPVSDAIHQNLPETEKQTDGALSTVVGFFNNVVLYPVKKANLTFRYKLEAFEDDLKEKIKDIPEENLQLPPTMIAGPTLEALRYTYDEAELREMYENLLASAMDTRKDAETHPAYVDAIRQMSPLDARVMAEIVNYTQLRCISIKFSIVDSTNVYSKGMPDYFVEELCGLADPFAVSASLINLSRLGLIEIINGTIKGADYEALMSHPYVISRKELFERFGNEFILKDTKSTVALNNYGINFAKVCLAKEL